MRKLLALVLIAAVAACSPAAPNTAVDNRPGGATPTAAVQRFFAAVHAQDLQAMGAVWGTSAGPARETMDRNEAEKREVILQCYFDFDTFRVLGTQPAQDGRQVVHVELTRGGRTRTPNVFTVQGPNGRWYVENLDIAAVRDFCGSAPANP
jgi:hypothetical protein